MVRGVDEVTDFVVTLKVALVWPAATVTLTGTVAAAVFELASDTVAPPAGAAAVRVTVPVDGVPPVTLAGLTAMAESATAATGGFTFRTTERVAPRAAVIVTGVEAVTEAVVTVKVVLDEPTGTVTLCGTVAVAGSLLDSVTTAQQTETTPVSVTVPIELAPPVRLVGLRVSDESVGPGGAGFTLMVASLSIPPAEALICDQSLRPSRRWWRR